MLCKVNDNIELTVDNISINAQRNVNHGAITLTLNTDSKTYVDIPAEMLILLGEDEKINHLEVFNNENISIFNSNTFTTLETANNYYDDNQGRWSTNYTFVQK